MQNGCQIVQFENRQSIYIYDIKETDYSYDFEKKVNQIFSRGFIYENKGAETLIYENKDILEKTKIEETEVENKKMKIGGTDWHTGISLDGKVYSIKVYNRALTQEEIAKNYEIDKIRFNIK